MKGDSQVIVAILMFIAGAFFGALIVGKLIVPSFESYLPALVTLLAAYLGVHYAFTLQSKKEKQDIRNKQIEAGQLELFNFTQIRNSLLSFQNQVIKSVNKETAFIDMRPTLHTLKIDSKLALENLSFLLKSDNPDLLLTLHIERENIQNILDAINERSKFYLEKVQPKWSDLELKMAGEFDPSDPDNPVIKALGEGMYQTMLHTTTQVIDRVESSVSRLESTENELRDTLTKMFPEDGTRF